MIKKFSFIVAVVYSLITVTASAATATYGFYKLTDNNDEDLSGQLSITLWDSIDANTQFGLSLNSADILFTVHNDAGIASSIAEVYFDDGLLGPSIALNSLSGYTNFSGGGANPGNLPGGNTASPAFVATTLFSADVNPGPPANGVNASNDVLGIQLGVGALGSYAGVITAVESGELRFGYHVRSIGALGGSDSYINTPAVPVPAAFWLFGSALIGLAGIKHKK